MRANRLQQLFLLGLFVLMCGWSTQTLALELPVELEPWQKWVLHDHPNASCPFIYTTSNRSCLWPSSLAVDIHANGGKFILNVDAFTEQWLNLPGENGIWPVQVKNQTGYLPVVNKQGKPAILISAGTHTIEGNYIWQSLPRSLSVPEQLGLLSLTVNNKKIAAPNIDANGNLWLSQNEKTTKKETTRDTLTAKVFRKLNDDTPQTITTLLQLNVSGREREIQLGPMLLPNATPRSFNSPLPARIEADGSLRIQVKPGRFDIELLAHFNHPTINFSFSPSNNLWPEQELWVFEANRAQRTVQLEGAPVIDASQTQMPNMWQNLPAYLLTPDAKLTLKELHRGDPKPAANDLELDKEMWLDFDGQGYTVRDNIYGTMHQGWRLEVIKPYELGRADIDEEPQLITTLADSGAAGIEVRTREIDLTAISRIPWLTTLPVSGWQQEFDAVSSNIALPPGWSALFVSGADSVSGAWVSAWNLWDIFLVLVIAVSLARVVSWPVGLLTLATLLMVYQRNQAPVLGWLNIAACLALLPYVKGRFSKLLSSYLGVSFILLTLIILPFIVQEARLVFYPQLERSSIHQPSFTKARIQQADGPQEFKKAELAPALMRSADAVEEVMVSGIRERYEDDAYLAAYDPGQKIQVGPGVPNWQWQTLHARWSGPVTAAETTRLILISPLFNRLGHALSIVLVTLLLALLIKQFLRFKPVQMFKNQVSSGTTAAALILLGVFSLPSEHANADIIVDKALLDELQQRLLEPPKCQPHCAAIESVNIAVTGESLVIQYWLNSQADLALPLPGTLGQWWPQTVLINTKATALLQTHNKQLYTYLTQGRHKVELRGSLVGLESTHLDFKIPLQNVTINAPGWTVGGLPSTKHTSKNVQLSREIKVEAQAERNRLLPDPIPPYVIVTRNIEFGLEWSVLTQVTRVSPMQGTINVAIPLLAGEAPTSGEIKTPGVMDIRIGENQRRVQWRSNLPITESILLTAPNSAQWTEVWTAKTTPIWHTTFAGIPTVAQTGDDVRPRWQPKPGETVTIQVKRPQPTDGAHMAIDNLSIKHSPGARASDSLLSLSLRATYGSQLDFPLPANATLKHVRINQIETPISQVQNQLKIPVVPGEQNIQIEWQTATGTSLKTQTPNIVLGLPATNINVNMHMPHDRWIIAVGGPALGPAILFWGVLAIVIGLAIALGKSKLTPLKPYEWVLLSLGVATFNLAVLVAIAAWFVVIAQRGKRQSAADEKTFNLMQVALFVFSAIALLALISSVPSSLLSQPDMYITGNNSSANTLSWYQDQSQALLPQAWVISIPMLAYKLVMLLWSLWLAFALMRWIRWGWAQLGVQGYWYTAPKSETDKKD